MVRLRSLSLMRLLGVFFLLATNILASPAVLGVDLGTEYIKAALVKPGFPLSIVLTRDSRRKETSAIAFNPVTARAQAGQFPECAYGADAIALSARFPGEVYPNLKTLLGLPAGHPIVTEYATRHPALQLQEHPTRGTVAFKTKTMAADEEAWMVEELLALELQSIQKNAENSAGGGLSVRSVVITVPPFYTTQERRAIQVAAELAGLKVLSLISDGMAVGLNYATTRQFPNINEGAKSEHHLVFDMGAGSTTATVLKFQSRIVKDVGKFNKTVQEVQSLGSGWDRTLGGDSLNYLIQDNMVSQFVESGAAKKISATAQGVRAHGRAMAKLLKESERVRHVLSANQDTSASFEGLYEDVDFKYKISRTEFETMAAEFPQRVATVVNDALKMAGLDVSDLDSIILHGGASRTPLVQKALEKVVGSPDKLLSNVNSDEAAVLGAGFRAAELSPSFRVKEIRVAEGAMYNAGIKWTNAKGKEQRQRVWTSVSPIGGAPKELTLNNLEDFSVVVYQQVGTEDNDVASLVTKNLTATVAALKEKYPSCAPSEVVFKLALRLSAENGEVAIAKAGVECEAEVKETLMDGVKNLFGFGKKEQSEDGGKEASADAASSKSNKESTESTESTESASPLTESASVSTDAKDAKPTEVAEGSKEGVKKKEIVNIPVEVIVEKSGTCLLNKDGMVKSKGRLQAFAASVKARVRREGAVNQLESFAHQIRDLVEKDDFVSASTENERTVLVEKSSEASEWLFGDGADASTAELKAKLKSLQDLAHPVQKRIKESNARPEAITKLKEVIGQTDSFLAGVYKQIKEHEEYLATASAASSSTSTSSASTESPTGEFDGLEDDDDAAPTTDTKKEEVGEKEPAAAMPPLFKREDLTEVEKLNKETKEWLQDMEAKQDKLSGTEDPVLLSSDIAAKQEKLSKLSMEVTMKGFLSFNKAKAEKAKAKKPLKFKGTNKDKAKAKKGEAAKGTDAEPELHGETFSQEDLDRMLEDFDKRQAEKDKKDNMKASGKDKKGGEGDKKGQEGDKKKGQEDETKSNEEAKTNTHDEL